jgi:transcriptional antiterminator NusG
MACRWYIVHAHSGFEKKVASSIQESATKKELDNFFEEVYVPIETVVEVKKGKKVNVERKFFPGYVMVKMEMNDDTWQVVKNTPRVTGFLGGGGNKPQPISTAEADSIFKQVQEGLESPKSSVEYNIGDSVKITDGPFESFVGVVEDVEEEKSKLKVAVSIFGRSTPVELDYTQVEKN